MSWPHLVDFRFSRPEDRLLVGADDVDKEKHDFRSGPHYAAGLPRRAGWERRGSVAKSAMPDALPVALDAEGLEERLALFALELLDDVARVARALHAAFHPKKVNYGAYGDTGRHLHFHLVPKYESGFEYGGVFEMNPKRTFPDPQNTTS